MSANHILFARRERNKVTPEEMQERQRTLEHGAKLHREHMNFHKEHDFVPDPDNPAHRLFFRPKRDPKKPRRIVTSGTPEARQHDKQEHTGLQGVRRIRVSGES